MASAEEDFTDGESDLVAVDRTAMEMPAASILLPMFALQFVEAFNNNALFTYVGFMMVSFGSTVDNAGFRAGFVACAYFAGQFFSSFVWGVAADRWGKRTCLLLGSSVTCLCFVGFGLSTNIYMAVALRFLAGAGNGNAPLIKAILGQLTNSKTQAQTLGFLGGVWGLGSILGSLLGGILADPASKWSAFDNVFFRTFPFVLPSWVSALILLAGVVATAVSLPAFKSDPNRPHVSRLSALSDAVVVKACLSYALQGYAQTFIDEILPLWMISSVGRGGLSFSANQVGWALGLGGGFLCLGQFILYKPVANRVGVIGTYRAGVITMLPVCICLPFVNRLTLSASLLWIGLIFLILARATANLFSMAASYALLNNSVDRDHLASANGLGQTMVALLRASAPLTAGPLFAWSLERSGPSLYWLVFLISFAEFGGIALFTLLFPVTLNKPKGEWMTEETVKLQPMT